eukprot:2006915-Alexandrium_andersonii.AAC.1
MLQTFATGAVLAQERPRSFGGVRYAPLFAQTPNPPMKPGLRAPATESIATSHAPIRSPSIRHPHNSWAL